HEPEAYADFERHVVDALPDEPVDAVGFSLGARTLLTIAVDHPDRFHRIVVAGVGANLFERDAERGRLIADAIAGDGDLDDPTARYFSQLADAPDIDRQAVAAFLRRSGPEFPADRLDHITCPVLVVLGDQDFAGPADPLMDALPDARLLTLRNVDHFATPKAFAFLDATLEFLDAVPG
ncbi:MAG: alpha/beta fold hydrolase, partial [Acidimicrobiales bacterium]|nr:alpha/beta fold hydrolase [Acidimicrobiales bacterium]